MNNTQLDFSQSMKRIDEINRWFEGDELDLEEALTKLKEGKELIQKCKKRLSEIENEFSELKTDFISDEAETNTDDSSTPEQNLNEEDSIDISF